MGEPWFKVSREAERLGVEALSSNFVLYGDLSHRVMTVIAESVPSAEIYSIDESFIMLTGMRNLTEFCRDLKGRVLQWTGIPVSIGIAETKGLAKLANRVAKTSARAGGVVNLAGNPAHVDAALRIVAVGDVWGVGRRYAERLIAMGIWTASDLARMDLKMLRHEFGLPLTRTALELRGEAVYDLETQPPPRQSCCVSRSFGEATTDIEDVCAAISEFAQTAAERLRGEGMVAGHLQAFAATSPFRRDELQGTLSASVSMQPPTADTGRMVSAALAMVRGGGGYPKGCRWAKAGVLLTDLVAADRVQVDLFTVGDTRRSDALMSALDDVNARYGRRTVSYGMADRDAEWRYKRDRLSPAWTTCWTDIPVVRT